MEKAEQIKKAMKLVEKQEALRASYVAARTKSEKEVALSAYRTLSGVILTEYDRDVCGLVWCERNRLEYGNELLDIEETCDVEELVEIFKIAGIKKFTVSISDTSLMDILAVLNKLGAKPTGMTRIYTQYLDFEGNREMTNAIVMEMKEEEENE